MCTNESTKPRNGCLLLVIFAVTTFAKGQTVCIPTKLINSFSGGQVVMFNYTDSSYASYVSYDPHNLELKINCNGTLLMDREAKFFSPDSPKLYYGKPVFIGIGYFPVSTSLAFWVHDKVSDMDYQLLSNEKPMNNTVYTDFLLSCTGIRENLPNSPCGFVDSV